MWNTFSVYTVFLLFKIQFSLRRLVANCGFVRHIYCHAALCFFIQLQVPEGQRIFYEDDQQTFGLPPVPLFVKA
jgi:hypothetical protein